jgi:hypothetical protein
MEQPIMTEIGAIVAEVKIALAAKQLEISRSSICIPFVTDAFKKRQREVISFERSAHSVSRDASAIAGFQKAANELLGEISKILI